MKMNPLAPAAINELFCSSIKTKQNNTERRGEVTYELQMIRAKLEYRRQSETKTVTYIAMTYNSKEHGM